MNYFYMRGKYALSSKRSTTQFALKRLQTFMNKINVCFKRKMLAKCLGADFTNKRLKIVVDCFDMPVKFALCSKLNRTNFALKRL